MAVELVVGSELADEQSTSADERTVAYDLTLGPGTNRVLIVRGSIAESASADVGDVLPTATFGGVAMAVQGLVLPPILASELGTGIGFVAAIALDDEATGSVDLVLTLGGGSGERNHHLVIAVWEGAYVADADLAHEYSAALTAAGEHIELTATPPTEGDLVMGIKWAMGLDGGFTMPAYFTPAEYADAYFDTYATGEDHIFPEIDTRSWSGWRFASDVTGDQATVLRPSEFAPEDLFVDAAGLAVFVIRAFGTVPEDDCSTNFNCECDDPNDAKTLAEYRVDLMVRLGFAAQKDNPPPGMEDLLTAFLQDAQNFLWRMYPALRTRRFFRWTMESGVRFYGIQSNDEDAECVRFLDPYKHIEGVWVVDANGTWLPMSAGIPGVWYTTACQPGIPVRYEIRQCLEVFPAPDSDDYKLYVKGHFGLLPFVEDEDKPTIDGPLVYMWALANGKAHYGSDDADKIAAQANTMLKTLVAGTHGTKKYVPGTVTLPPAVMPLFLPLSGAPP